MKDSFPMKNTRRTALRTAAATKAADASAAATRAFIISAAILVAVAGILPVLRGLVLLLLGPGAPS
jgi:hypothetical protein